MVAFSKRHRRALGEERLKFEVDTPTRGRIRRLMDRHDFTYSRQMDNGWNYDTSALEDLADNLRDLYGRDTLPSRTGTSLRALLEDGFEPYIFDALELYPGQLQPGSTFARELNQVLQEEGVPWLMIDGEMVQLDGEFAREQMALRAESSLGAAGFEGAAQELRTARNDIVDGDHRGAIHNAGKAHESVMKALLSQDHGAAKKLVQDLSHAGFFDGLPTHLREPFVKQVVGALPWMRNHLGDHGQGEKTVDVPRPYAELAVDLAAAYVHLLITLKVSLDGSEQEPARPSGDFSPQPLPSEPDFSLPPPGNSEDDIPF